MTVKLLDIKSMTGGQTYKAKDIEISFVPVRHFSTRGLFDEKLCGEGSILKVVARSLYSSW